MTCRVHNETNDSWNEFNFLLRFCHMFGFHAAAVHVFGKTRYGVKYLTPLKWTQRTHTHTKCMDVSLVVFWRRTHTHIHTTTYKHTAPKDQPEIDNSEKMKKMNKNKNECVLRSTFNMIWNSWIIKWSTYRQPMFPRRPYNLFVHLYLSEAVSHRLRAS